MKNKLLAALLCAGLLLISLSQTVQATADYTYIDENGNTQTAAGVTPIAADTALLATGWYVVNSDVTCNTTITVSGDVSLILSDGFTLTVTGGSDNAGINVPAGSSIAIYGQAGGTGTVIAQGGASGAGIGGGKAQNGGSITINGGTVTATGGTGGAGIGGGAGGTGGNGGDGYYGSAGGTGGIGGTVGTVTINGGIITANGRNGGAGIGGGIGGNGGRGGSWTVGFGGGQGGSGGTGGTVIINGGMVKVSGGNYAKIDGGEGGTGGNGGFRYSGGAGGRGGSGGNGGTVIISGGTVASTGSGDGIGIGGGMGGAGGIGGDGFAGASYGSGSHGATGTASSISDCVINGGSVDAEIGCMPTTGGGTPANVYLTVVCLLDAADKDVSVLSVSQNSSSVSYGINDMKTDANGKLYLYLPAYDGDTTAEITEGGLIYNGYHGWLSNTATYSSPNVLKIDQSALNFTNTDVRTFTFGDEIVLDTEVTGGTLPGTVQYTYSGIDLSMGGAITDSATLPTNAGNYTIKATLSGNDLYYDAIATKGFMINPKSIAGFAVEDISEQTYTGENITPPTIVKDGTRTLLSGTDYTVTYENNKDAGTAVAAIAGKGNYTGNLAKNFVVLPKDISLTLSAAPDEAKVGSNVVLTASILGAVDLPAGTVTFKYEDTVIEEAVPVNADGSGYSAVTTWSNVPTGEYNLTASYVAAGSDNYICVSNGLISKFSITKYDQPDFAFTDGTDYSVSQGTISKTYGDSAFTLQTSGKLSTVAVNFAVTSGNDIVSVDAVTGLVSILKSGTAVVTATSPTDATYNEVSTTVTVRVAKADQSGFGFAEPTINRTYGDGPFIISASGGQSSGSVTYAVTDGSNIAMVDAVTGEVTVLRSGTAVITATKGTDDCYREATSQITINAAKADQSGFGFAEPTINKTYGNGPFIISASGGQSSGSVTYAVTDGSNIAMVDAVTGEVTVLRSGTAVITAIKGADDCYQEAASQITVQVAKADQSGFEFAELTINKTYGDGPFIISASGGQSSGSVTYAVTDGSSIATVDAVTGEVTVLRSGIATITATSPTDDRYNKGIAKMTIHVAKADQIDFHFEKPSISKTYGDASFVIPLSNKLSSGQVTYTVTAGINVASVDEDSGQITILTPGTAVITAMSPSDDKYNETSAQMTLYVTKADQSGLSFDRSSINKTYGDEPFVISASGGQSSGMVTYSVENGGNIISVDAKTGKVTIRNTGSAVIIATKAGDDFYNSMVSTLSINVGKAATSVITPPAAADIPVIGALSASVLSGGAGSVPGSFSWTSPDDIVSASGMFEVTFTPEDSINYATSTCKVKVQVTPIISDSSTGIIFDLLQATLPTGISSVSIALSTEPITGVDNSISDMVNSIYNADPNYNGNVMAIYDLKLLDQNGNQITDFTGTIIVRIPIPVGLTGNLYVLWYNPETETTTDMNATLKDDYLVFETTHFSYYAVVQKTELSVSSETEPNSDMGNKTLLIVALMLLGLLLVPGFTAVVRIKNKRV